MSLTEKINLLFTEGILFSRVLADFAEKIM